MRLSARRPGSRQHAAVKIVTRPKDESELEARYENGFDEESVAASYAEELQQYASEYRLMLEMKGQSNIISCDDFTLIENPNGIGGKIYIRMELLTPLKKMQKEIFTKEETVIRLGMDICRALDALRGETYYPPGYQAGEYYGVTIW